MALGPATQVRLLLELETFRFGSQSTNEKSLFGSYFGYWLLFLVSDERICPEGRLYDKVSVQITEF